MAAPDDIVHDMTLELGPDKVPALEFLKAVRAFAGLLDGIAKDACGDKKAVSWEISVARGSQLIRADITPATDPKAVHTVRTLLRRPPQRTMNRFRRFPKSIEGTRIWIGQEDCDSLRDGDDEQSSETGPFTEYGTVEGKLDTLSARGGVHFTIYEPIWDKGVNCSVPSDLVDTMQKMWRQRIAAHGMVHYDAEGRPMSIRAEEVELFPYDETPLKEFRGLLRTE